MTVGVCCYPPHLAKNHHPSSLSLSLNAPCHPSVFQSPFKSSAPQAACMHAAKGC